jgi:hypothetical protein
VAEVIELDWPAHVGERFEDGVFAASVGKELTVHDNRGPGEPVAHRGRLLSAEVLEDGLSVRLRIEVDR